MLTRQEVYAVVDKERAYQDKTYDPNQVLSSGLTRAERDRDVTSHICLLESYIQKAREAWVQPGANAPALKQIAKVAAIAVRALERSGGSEIVQDGVR